MFWAWLLARHPLPKLDRNTQTLTQPSAPCNGFLLSFSLLPRRQQIENGKTLSVKESGHHRHHAIVTLESKGENPFPIIVLLGLVCRL